MADDDLLGALRDTTETLHGAASALRVAELDGPEAFRKVAEALYFAEDDNERNLVEAHQILRFPLRRTNASYYALHGAAQVLEAATDTLFGAKDLLEEIDQLDDFGEMNAADTLRGAVARLDAAGLLEAAGDAIREATVVLNAPDNLDVADLTEDCRADILALRAICKALRDAVRTVCEDSA